MYQQLCVSRFSRFSPISLTPPLSLPLQSKSSFRFSLRKTPKKATNFGEEFAPYTWILRRNAFHTQVTAFGSNAFEPITSHQWVNCTPAELAITSVLLSFWVGNFQEF